MAKEYNIVQAPILAFFSRPFYSDVAIRWGAGVVVVLLLVELITWAFPITYGHGAVKEFAQGEGREIIDQIPDIMIRDGVVTMDEPSPYFINDPDTGRPVAMFDTTGQTNASNMPEGIMILLTDRAIVSRNNTGKIAQRDLVNVETLDLTPEIIHQWIEDYAGWIAVVLYVFLAIFGLCYRLLQGLIYAAIALGIASATGRTVTFGQAYKIALIAVVPVILIDTALSAIGVLAFAPMCVWPLMCLGIAVGYLWFGVTSIGDDDSHDEGVSEFGPIHANPTAGPFPPLR